MLKRCRYKNGDIIELSQIYQKKKAQLSANLQAEAFCTLYLTSQENHYFEKEYIQMALSTFEVMISFSRDIRL